MASAGSEQLGRHKQNHVAQQLSVLAPKFEKGFLPRISRYLDHFLMDLHDSNDIYLYKNPTLHPMAFEPYLLVIILMCIGSQVPYAEMDFDVHLNLHHSRSTCKVLDQNIKQDRGGCFKIF